MRIFPVVELSAPVANAALEMVIGPGAVVIWSDLLECVLIVVEVPRVPAEVDHLPGTSSKLRTGSSVAMPGGCNRNRMLSTYQGPEPAAAASTSLSVTSDAVPSSAVRTAVGSANSNW